MPDRIETICHLHKSNRFLLAASALFVLFLVATAGSFTWYSLQRSCEVDAVKEASTILVRQRDRFDHTYQFATSASQNSVVRPVAELQQILMDTQEVPVPACLRTGKNELVNYMGAVIRAFLAFGAQEADATIRGLLDQSDAHYDNFSTELEAVHECAPFCIP